MITSNKINTPIERKNNINICRRGKEKRRMGSEQREMDGGASSSSLLSLSIYLSLRILQHIIFRLAVGSIVVKMI